MQANGEAVADFLEGLMALANQVLWFIISPPFRLWYRGSLSCNPDCVPTSGPFAFMAWCFLAWFLVRLVYLWRGRTPRNLAYAIVIGGIYFSLPAIYSGLGMLEYQLQTDAARRR